MSVEDTDGVRILFVPGLGGVDAGTGRLCDVLAQAGGVTVLTLPDLEARCAVIYDLPSFVADWSNRISTSDRGDPIVLAGYSTGGIIAHLLAQELDTRGVAVAGVVLFDTSASLPDPKPFYFLRQLIRASRKRVWAGWADAVLLVFTAAGLVDTLRRLIRLMGRLGLEQRAEALRKRLLLYLWRRVAARLQLGTSDVPTILFAAAKPRGGVLTASRGWHDHARTLTIVSAPGDHWSMLGEPQLRVLGEQIVSRVAGLAKRRTAPHASYALGRDPDDGIRSA